MSENDQQPDAEDAKVSRRTQKNSQKSPSSLVCEGRATRLGQAGKRERRQSFEAIQFSSASSANPLRPLRPLPVFRV